MTSNRLDFESHLAALERECDRIVAAGGDDFRAPGSHLPGMASLRPARTPRRGLQLLGHPASGGVVGGSRGAELRGQACRRGHHGLVRSRLGRTAGKSCRAATANSPVGTGRARTSQRNGSAGAWRSRPPSTVTTSSSRSARRRDRKGSGRRRDRRVDRGPPGDRGARVAEACRSAVCCAWPVPTAAAWTVEVTAGRLRWREGRGPADAVLVGSASDLYLYCWNRRPLEVLELTGNRQVAAAWSSLAI